jgi:hypothetical protein
MDSRLPAHLEIAAIRRLAESQGGFAAVLSTGERDAGTILVVTIFRGEPARLYERMPQLDGNRPYTLSRQQDAENTDEFSDYLDRRKRQDPDLWLIEADVADSERFIASLPR